MHVPYWSFRFFEFLLLKDRARVRFYANKLEAYNMPELVAIVGGKNNISKTTREWQMRWPAFFIVTKVTESKRFFHENKLKTQKQMVMRKVCISSTCLSVYLSKLVTFLFTMTKGKTIQSKVFLINRANVKRSSWIHVKINKTQLPLRGNNMRKIISTKRKTSIEIKIKIIDCSICSWMFSNCAIYPGRCKRRRCLSNWMTAKSSRRRGPLTGHLALISI